MKKILLIASGGTIASCATSKGYAPIISAKQLLAYVPSVNKICHADFLDLFNIDSTNITPEHWVKLTQAVEQNYNDYDGFVICHGTDTMAYTSSALSYMVQNSKKPIIVTGSQKPISMDVTDAKTNLIDSFLFACEDKAHGVNIVFDGNVIAGTRAKKLRTKSYNAFSSINYPYIANIQDGKIVFYVDDKDKISSDVIFYKNINSNVFLLKLIPNISHEIIAHLKDVCDAVIIESFGLGGLPNYNQSKMSFASALKEFVADGKVAVMATQVPHEGSDLSVYQVGTKVRDIKNVLEARDMTLEAVVTKLMWVLGNFEGIESIEREFYKTINHDILFV